MLNIDGLINRKVRFKEDSSSHKGEYGIIVGGYLEAGVMSPLSLFVEMLGDKAGEIVEVRSLTFVRLV